MGVVFKDHGDQVSVRGQQASSYAQQAIAAEKRYQFNGNLQKQGSADSFDTEKEQNLSIIDASFGAADEEESQSDEAKNEFKDYTDIELHSPTQAPAIKNYTQKVPISGRQTKSPLSLTMIT